MTSRRPNPQQLLVTVVSKNPSTLQGLDAYLRSAGVSTTTTGAIERLVEMTPPSAAAVILFPDEYSSQSAIDALTALRKARPDLLAVIVTHEPHRFQTPTGNEAAAASPLVMPKPVWAWTILDAVRARLDSVPGSTSTP
jgi:hypothetical protein